jgi:hypothetical protein
MVIEVGMTGLREMMKNFNKFLGCEKLPNQRLIDSIQMSLKS